MLSVPNIAARLSGFSYRQTIGTPDSPWAGVAAILRPADAGAEVLMIRRTENPNDPWSGHMAMPGGRQDPGDLDVQRAAERETCEEVGIDLQQHARLLGRLNDVSAVARGRKTGLVIAPFVYAIDEQFLGETAEPTPNYEVQEAVWVPLSDLNSPRFRSTRPYVFGETQLLLPCWNWHGRVIWGLTYNMLDSLIRIAKGQAHQR